MKISAIISTYNQPLALKAVLNSIINQKILPHEVIIADDGSDEETAELILKFQNNYPVELKHVWHEDKGFRLAAIRNKAITESTGDYLLFSDGDLIFHPKFFFDFKKNMDSKNALIGSRVFLTKSASTEILEKNGFISFNFFSKKIAKNRVNAIRIPGVSQMLPYKQFSPKLRGGLLCVRKKHLVAVNGWNEDFEGWGKEDTEFLARLSFSGLKFKKLKLAGITFHLWHPVFSREKLVKNENILSDSMSKQKAWCKNGLVKSEKP